MVFNLAVFDNIVWFSASFPSLNLLSLNYDIYTPKLIKSTNAFHHLALTDYSNLRVDQMLSAYQSFVFFSLKLKKVSL